MLQVEESARQCARMQREKVELQARLAQVRVGFLDFSQDST
jgi:hypothetical protein